MGLITEIDYGTPESKTGKQVTLTVDGKIVTVPEGTSIMRAAMEGGVEIPKLCATDMLDSFGSCRVCLVEIEGRNGTPASCTTQVGEGMVVHTVSERLDTIRRGVMELYVSDHPTGWGEKAGTGASEFDRMAEKIGLSENRYGVEGRNHVVAEDAAADGGVAPGEGSLTIDYMVKDESNPYFTYDPSQCIVCSRCVRACADVQGTFALTIEGRGFESRMVASMSEDFVDPNASPAAPACRHARPTRCAKRRCWKKACPNVRFSPPVPIAVSAATSRPR
jgi:formate dehydrogenase major subunit